MDQELPRHVQGDSPAGERYCALCKGEGHPNETARGIVAIRPREGGRLRKVAVCLNHADKVGKAESPYELIAQPARSRNPVHGRPANRLQGKTEKGDIKRTLRRVERYSKTQRGRLGE